MFACHRLFAAGKQCNKETELNYYSTLPQIVSKAKSNGLIIIAIITMNAVNETINAVWPRPKDARQLTSQTLSGLDASRKGDGRKPRVTRMEAF